MQIDTKAIVTCLGLGALDKDATIKGLCLALDQASAQIQKQSGIIAQAIETVKALDRILKDDQHAVNEKFLEIKAVVEAAMGPETVPVAE